MNKKNLKDKRNKLKREDIKVSKKRNITKQSINKNSSDVIKKNKRKKKNSVLLDIIFCSCIVVFLLSALFLGKTLIEYHVAKKEYSELSQNVDIPETGDINYTTVLRTLKSMNSDCVGYIIIEGTDIEYPIMQCENNSYYLNHTISNKKNSSGAIFMDTDNSKDFLDSNTILYGHNMKDGSMFAHLSEYRNRDFMKKNNIVTIIHENGIYKYEIFAACLYDSSDPYREINLTSDLKMAKFNSLIYSKDIASITKSFSSKDKILTLSTCAYDRDDARLVLHCILIQNE